ncbi:hypothetical protein [Deinococcus peraridilitoris]|uniref:Uncharacterized protein n=1 Tax=Deinococcus peraridilitoris (strain DSM 19664 / LMG 22246 / CIP 109416 / KR-200) TaxID=937777 RepID=L0A4N6_DEIPD|nr:hypothetical protein [Deinococcus peraridilitoris]AFZ68821.1 hypothetical protein Deipe_3382 [Deinococcus peraridilitoris DSM 19664]
MNIAERQSIKEQFSESEWSDILKGPNCAALYVMSASPSGALGLRAETRAVNDILVNLVRNNPDSALLGALALDYHYAPEAAAPAQEAVSHVAEVSGAALAGVRQALLLVDSRASSQDAQEYRQLLLQTAIGAAKASAQGGILGLGGVQVDSDERRALRELEELLATSAE